MIGIVPIDNTQNQFYLNPSYPGQVVHDVTSHQSHHIIYQKTDNVDLLMHPDAILLDEDADSNEEIIAALKERYPDIEPCYGQVLSRGSCYYVYDQPGINAKDQTWHLSETTAQIEAICRKYGKVRILNPHYTPPKNSALVFSINDGLNYVRYDEKIRKRRIDKIKAKAERPKRNLQFLQEIVKKLLSGTPEQDFLVSKLLQKHSDPKHSCQIKFDHTYTVHQRNRMLLEIFLLTRFPDPKPSSDNVSTYSEAKAQWQKAVPDPKLTDEDSVAVIKMLNGFFQVGNA